MPGVNGNFSIGSGGGVHQFADSQFGHVFAHRDTREEASTALVQTLSEFSVRGPIHCNVKYLMTLLEKDDFRASSTSMVGWIDCDQPFTNQITSSLRVELFAAPQNIRSSRSRSRNV